MSAFENVPTTVLLPCSRLKEDFTIGDRLAMRTAAVADFVLAYEEAFESDPEALIVCAGGASAVNGEVMSASRPAEAEVARDDLVSRGVPRELIEIDRRPQKLYGAAGYPVKADLIVPSWYKPEHKLAVALPNHAFKRFALSLGAVGINKDSLHQIPVAEKEKQLREAFLYRMTKHALNGVSSEDELIELDQEPMQFRWGIKA